MPRKSVPKTKKEVVSDVASNVVSEVVAPVQEVAPVTEPKPETKKRGKKPKVVKDAPQTEKEVTPASEVKSEAKDTKEAKVRRVPTRESVEQEFDDLVKSLDDEIAKLRSSSDKSKGVKFLRTVNKKVKNLRSHALRITKTRSTVKRNNNNSGFKKPVQITKELAKFTGWNDKDLHSRVEVTKFICDYVKEHNLQNPEDRRKICVEKDLPLKGLLGYDSKNDDKPLTYYSLQTYLKKHFVKPEVTK